MNDIKQEVRRRYGAIAVSSQAADGAAGAATGCCGTTDCCAPPAGARSTTEDAVGAGSSTAGGGNGNGCCAPGSPSVTRLVEYADQDVEVADGADLGLGCGIPTRHAAIRAGETVLDLGSGAGVDVFLAAKAVGPAGRVIGVDMTSEMLDLARANAAKGGYENVEFRLGEIEALPVADAAVDLVLSNCVINLVPDKARAFAEIHRVLRPGGRFTISDVVSYGAVPASIRGDIEQWVGCVAGAMDRDAYLGLIRAAGFTGVEVVDSVAYDYLKGEDYGLMSVTVAGAKPAPRQRP